MHFGIKCIFVYIFLWKMYAEHFPLENVMRCQNAFWHQMHFCTAKMHFGIKYIFASHFVLLNIFLWKMFSCAKMHLMLPLHFVYKMLESGKMHFGVHFPKKNVQRTFSKGKCSAVQKCI